MTMGRKTDGYADVWTLVTTPLRTIAILLVVGLFWGCGEEATNLDSWSFDTANLDIPLPDLPVNDGPDMGGDTGSNGLPTGPLDLFDAFQLQDITTLNIEWDQSQSGPDPNDPEHIYRLIFSFESQTYMGKVWRHNARLYIPTEQTKASAAALAVIQAGTMSEAVDPEEAFFQVYGLDSARLLQVPILVIDDLPPDELSIDSTAYPQLAMIAPHCFDTPLDEVQLVDCGIDFVSNSMDFSMCPFAAGARVLIRGGLAAKQVLGTASAIWPEFPMDTLEASTVIYGGESLVGVSVRQAMVVDPRAQAGFSAGADIGDIVRFGVLEGSVWPEGPYWLSPDAIAKLSNSLVGQAHIKTFDVRAFAASLAGKRLALARGTNDERFPLGSLDLYGLVLPAELMLLYLPNYAAGMDDPAMVSLWRTVINRQVFGLEPPKVVAEIDDTSGTPLIKAVVTGCQAINGLCLGVKAWVTTVHSQSVDSDFRDAIWSEVPMNPSGGGNFVGVLDPVTLPSHAAVYVQATDILGNLSPKVSSRILYFGAPYPLP